MKRYFSVIPILALLLLVLANCSKETTKPEVKIVATPTFDLDGGEYSSAQSVSISSATDGATIRYTTDGSDPLPGSAVYNSPIEINSSTTLKARASKSGWTDSSVASVTYAIDIAETVATPTFDPPGGSYSGAQNVSISCSTGEATIRYTTNGDDPTPGSAVYDSPILVSSTSTIKAKGFAESWTPNSEGLAPSNTASASYAIDLTPCEMVHIPGGTFTMGNTRGGGSVLEYPAHTVTLSSFHLGKYEVTQAEYEAVMGSNPAQYHGIGDIYPVYFVNWYAATKYCNLRSINEGLMPVYSLSGSTNPTDWGDVPEGHSNQYWDSLVCDWYANGYRLPTEAEWEYAARGGTDDPDYLYSGSDDIDEVGWYYYNSDNTSHPVGSKAPNALGLYDMSGNVCEWCWDWGIEYNSSSQNNPTGPDRGRCRVNRGGNWDYGINNCRVTYRDSIVYPGISGDYNGFRVCRSGY